MPFRTWDNLRLINGLDRVRVSRHAEAKALDTIQFMTV
jgi:hypothetical protein